MASLPSDPSTTHRLSELSRATLEALRRRAAPRHSLFVYHTGGIEASVLTAGVPVIVGRKPSARDDRPVSQPLPPPAAAPGKPPALLPVADPSLSRSHARFTLSADGRVLVEDLGSTNGVWLRGARIPLATLAPGDEVVLGNVLACLRAVGPADPSPEPVHRVSTSADRAPIAVAPAMRAALDLAARVASATVPVIVQGETGTGKEVIARYIHERGPRRTGPLVCVNCGAIPAQLVESTLFGHEKGAFTGAGQRQKGVFEEASTGTVFLDEIGELPPPAQAALLRVLETHRFSRVGSVKELTADVRVLAATHRDLAAMCAEGKFRTDLYYRLNTVVLPLPPLRDRPEDIEPLAHRFLADMSAGRPLHLSPDALSLLRSHTFPGNVRELRNALEHAVVVSQTPTITAADLPPSLQRAVETERAAETPPAEPPAPVDTASAQPPTDDLAGGDLRSHLQAYESRILFDTLQATGWNQSEAARRLGVPIRTLSHKVKALGLKKPEG
ncbi:MAG: sigma 54-interacting transcriptional regulator [Polyangiaceae bacterium]